MHIKKKTQHTTSSLDTALFSFLLQYIVNSDYPVASQLC